MNKFGALIAGLGAGLGLFSAAYSQSTEVLITNLPGDDNNLSPISGGAIKAMGFETGGLAYNLTEAVLRLEVTGDPRVVVDVSIYKARQDNFPGEMVGRFETVIIQEAVGPKDYVFRPVAAPFRTIFLEANTIYYLVAWTRGPGTVNWMASFPSVFPSGVFSHFTALWSGSGAPNPPTSGASTVINSYELRGMTRPAHAHMLQDPATGQVAVAGFTGIYFTTWRTFPQVVGSAWEVLDFGHFAGTHHTDALLRHKTTGQLAIWETNGYNFVQFNPIPQVPPSVWEYKGAARMGTSNEAMVFQNPQSGVVVVGITNGQQITQWRVFPKVPNPAWEIVAVADFNGDNIGDMMFQNKVTRQVAVWRTDGHDFTTWHVYPQTPSADWEIIDAVHSPALPIQGVIFRHKSTGDYAHWSIAAGGNAFQTWLHLHGSHEPRFVYKGLGRVH